MIYSSMLLRRALQADALISGAMALLLTFGAGALAPLLALPHGLLLETGLFLILYVALVGWLASRTTLPRPLVLLVVVGNALWTLGSIALLISNAVAPNGLGLAFVVLQAIAVGVFAELQLLGLRRSSQVAMA